MCAFFFYSFPILVIDKVGKYNFSMVFVSYLLGSLLAIAIDLLARFFVKKKKGEKPLQFAKEDIWRYVIPLGVGLLFSLMFFFLFPRFPWLNGSWLFLCLSLLLLWMNPFSWFQKKEAPQKRKIICVSLLSLGLLLEAFLMNYRAYPLKESSYVMDKGSSSLVLENTSLEKDDIKISNGSIFTISNIQEDNPANVQLNFNDINGASISVKVKYSFDGTNFSDLTTYKLSGTTNNSSILSLGKYSEHVESFRLEFSFEGSYYASSDYAYVSFLSFNVPLEFHFSLFRVGFYSLSVILFTYLPYFARKEGEKEPTKIPYLVVGVFASVLLIGTLSYMFIHLSSTAVAYPIPIEELHAHTSGTTGKIDIFVSLFDAFKKGRIDLDLDVDPKLLELTNPWSPAERNAAHVSYYWDHAFYNGKYYSYYGPLPVIVASFPFYFLSGCRYVPTAFGLELIGMAFLIPSFLLLMIEIFRLIQKKVNWGQYALFSAVGLVTSMMIMAITWKDGWYHEAIYHVPDIYGLASFDLFFFFVLMAYREKRLRILPLSFAGLFFVFIVFSRPNLFLGLLVTAPFLFGILCEKDVPFKKKIVEFIPMISILLVGAVIACLYNYKRFDSILEFGQSYQLNVTDQRYLTYSPEKILPTIFHFFWQGGNFYNRFPYISCTYKRYDFETAALAPYVESFYGLLGVPLFWITLLTPFLFFKEERKSLKVTGILIPFFLFFFAFTTYSKAGLCPRYMIEFYHMSSLFSLMGLLKMRECAKENQKLSLWITGGGYFLLMSSLFICLCLSFDSFDGMKEGSCFGLLLRLREVFLSFNY